MMQLFGKNVCIEALKSPHKVREIFIFEELKYKSPEFISQINDHIKVRSIPIRYSSSSEMAYKAKGANPKGVITIVDLVENSAKSIFSNGAIIYIYKADEDQNIGAIIRSAESFGFDGVILPKDKSLNETIIRTSAGAALNIPICSNSIFQSIKLARENDYDIVAIERGGYNVSETLFYKKSMFIIGGENYSITQQILDQCNKVVSIEQKGKVNSLNMSVASAIVMYNYSIQN